MGIAYLGKCTVTTRKSHMCWGCGKHYNQGTEMECVRQVVDYRATSIYWCRSCMAILAGLPPDCQWEIATEGIDCGSLNDWVQSL